MNQNLQSLLRSEKPQFGLVIMYPAAGAIERMGPDWDWFFIDGQHGELGYAETLDLVRAADVVARPALVRVSDHSFGPIGKALDMGAAGVIAPCINTPEQARAVVFAAKFPPIGGRSYGGRRIIDFAGRNYSDSANVDTLCVVQIESPEAIANAEAIAAVPGVDALFLGHDDILLQRGIGVTAPRNRDFLETDMRAIAKACETHGKIAGMISIDPTMIALAAELGFRLIGAGSDVMFLASGSRQASAAARTALSSSLRESDTAGSVSSVKQNSPY